MSRVPIYYYFSRRIPLGVVDVQVPMSKVNWDARMDSEYINNYKVTYHMMCLIQQFRKNNNVMKSRNKVFFVEETQAMDWEFINNCKVQYVSFENTSHVVSSVRTTCLVSRNPGWVSCFMNDIAVGLAEVCTGGTPSTPIKLARRANLILSTMYDF